MPFCRTLITMSSLWDTYDARVEARRKALPKVPISLRDLQAMRGGYGKVKSADDRPVPADILEKLIPLVIARGRQDSPLIFVGPRDTEKIRTGVVPMPAFPDDQSVFLVLFCGDIDSGHYVPCVYSPKNRALLVYCHVFQDVKGGNEVVKWWVEQLECALVTRPPLTKVEYGCALNTVLLAAKVSKVAIPTATKRAVLNSETMDMAMTLDHSMACLWCNTRSCTLGTCPGPKPNPKLDVSFQPAPRTPHLQPSRRIQWPVRVAAVIVGVLACVVFALGSLAVGPAGPWTRLGAHVGQSPSVGTDEMGVKDSWFSYVSLTSMAGGNAPLPVSPLLGKDSPRLSPQQTLDLLKKEAAHAR